jgi:hypothetical protein
LPGQVTPMKISVPPILELLSRKRKNRKEHE